MSANAAVLILLASCCLGLAVVQAAEWPRTVLWAMSAGLAAAMLASGELASQTSMATVIRWVSAPERRQDLSALLLAEALLFGGQAARRANADGAAAWRLLGLLPPPSLLLALFLAQVALMLTVDGVDYGTLSALWAIGIGAGFAACAGWLRWALPDTRPRCALRVALHGLQAAAGLWLARPPSVAPVDAIPLEAGRLATVAVVIAGLVATGWLIQRRH